MTGPTDATTRADIRAGWHAWAQLYQSEVWIPRAGQRAVLVARMSPGARRAVIEWMEANVDMLASLDHVVTLRILPRGEAAARKELEDMVFRGNNATAWLATLPLVMALNEGLE